MNGEQIATMVSLAKQGRTRREVAQVIGCSYFTLCQVSKRLKVPFRHGLFKDQLKPKGNRPRRRERTPVGQIKAAGILDQMTQQERADTLVLLRKGGFNAVDALTKVGRADLVPRVREIETNP